MIHLDTIIIPSGQHFCCCACELPLEPGTTVVREWFEIHSAPGFPIQLALLHKHCAKDLGSDMVIEKSR